MPVIKSTCCYCGVGRRVSIATDGEGITGERGDPDPAPNFGRLRTGNPMLRLRAGTEGRLLRPESRTCRAKKRPLSTLPAKFSSKTTISSIIAQKTWPAPATSIPVRAFACRPRYWGMSPLPACHGIPAANRLAGAIPGVPLRRLFANA
jgi:hypothetical protein